MCDRSAHGRRFLQVNRRFLSDDVHQRVAVSVAKSSTDTPLPLAQPEKEMAELVSVEPAPPAQPAMVQALRAEGQDEADEHARPRPNPQQIADRVYQFMRQDLRLERERKGW